MTLLWIVHRRDVSVLPIKAIIRRIPAMLAVVISVRGVKVSVNPPVANLVLLRPLPPLRWR